MNGTQQPALMTAADFCAAPCIVSQIKKTKLDNNSSPADGTCTVLAVVHTYSFVLKTTTKKVKKIKASLTVEITTDVRNR